MEKHEKTIYQILQQLGTVRYSELEKAALRYKNGMAKKTFQKHLKSLVEKGLLVKTPVKRQNIVYSINPKIYEKKSSFEAYKEFLAEYKDGLNNLEKQFKKLSDEDKLERLLLLAKMISFIEWQLLPRKNVDPKILGMMLSFIAPLKMGIIQLAAGKTKKSKVLDMLLKELYLDAIEISTKLNKLLNELKF